MTILQGQDAWHQQGRWNEPCGRPTYRAAVLELAPGLLTHGIAIAVAYDAANFLWNAADPDDQSQLENLWSGFVIDGNAPPFIRYASTRSSWRFNQRQVPDTSPITPRPHRGRNGHALTRRHR